MNYLKTLIVSIALILIVGSVIAVENIMSTGASAKGSTLAKTNTNVTLSYVCMQNAIEHRDSAMINATDKFAQDSKAALTVRKESLKASWAITTKITQANSIIKAWNNFKVSWKKVQTDFRNSRRIAWSNYRSDIKKCKLTSNTYDSSEVADVINV